ncbi:MAG: PPC domain-containing DNA-binding protein [Fastidiosipilaceae bacterium]|jgi:predicted DNA-binding protein with PD1-like motif
MEYVRNNQDVMVRMDKGDEIVASLKRLMDELEIEAGYFQALGAVDRATVGIYYLAAKQYKMLDIEGDFEVSSLFGTMSRQDGEPYIHAHATIADVVGGRTYAGHLNEARISGTLELALRVMPMAWGRTYDEVTGLNLLTFEEPHANPVE